MKILKITLIALTAMSTITSCKKGGVFCYGPNGNQITEQRNLSNFDEIDLGMAADVYLAESSDFSVSVSASDNLMEIIETKVIGDRLLIDLKNNKCLKGNSDVVFYISAPNIDGISVSGSGKIIAEGKLNSPKMDIDISGSGKIEMDSLMTDDFSANISGSGEIYVVGLDTASKQDLNISGSGNFHGFDMPVMHSDIDISGSGKCEVHVISSLKARISGSGEVRYMGTPSVDSNISGSGTIKQY